MAIRSRISDKGFQQDAYVRRMLRVAIEQQKKHIDNLADFEETEVVMRGEHSYLTWLNGLQRQEGKLSIATS